MRAPLDDPDALVQLPVLAVDLRDHDVQLVPELAVEDRVVVSDVVEAGLDLRHDEVEPGHVLLNLRRHLGASGVDLVDLRPDDARLHLDLAHILPDTINSLLFMLVVIGKVRAVGRVYHRNSADHIYLEIPSSPEDRTGQDLYFCNLLPTTSLTVAPESLDFWAYSFQHDDNGSVMRIPDANIMLTSQTNINIVPRGGHSRSCHPSQRKMLDW